MFNYARAHESSREQDVDGRPAPYTYMSGYERPIAELAAKAPPIRYTQSLAKGDSRQRYLALKAHASRSPLAPHSTHTHFQRMWFFDAFEMSPTPSSTLVMSYIRLF